MMKSLFCLISSFILCSTLSFADSTTTGESGFGDIPEKSCNISVRNPGYTIRRKPSVSGSERSRGRCGGTLRSNGWKSVLALGTSGPWIRIGHPNCNKGQENEGEAWVHRKAFHPSELRALANGQCAAMRNYGYRNPPKAPAPNYSGSVTAKGSHGHRFILDRCLGITKRNGRGQGGGHYGDSRVHGTHHGTDYIASIGTPLKSPCAGRVTRSGLSGGRKKGAGNLIEITCDNGDRFKMFHLQFSSPPMLRAGSRVGIGTVFGKVGKTGNADRHYITVPHVHIEYSPAGKGRRNPASLWNCGNRRAGPQ